MLALRRTQKRNRRANYRIQSGGQGALVHAFMESIPRLRLVFNELFTNVLASAPAQLRQPTNRRVDVSQLTDSILTEAQNNLARSSLQRELDAAAQTSNIMSALANATQVGFQNAHFSHDFSFQMARLLYNVQQVQAAQIQREAQKIAAEAIVQRTKEIARAVGNTSFGSAPTMPRSGFQTSKLPSTSLLRSIVGVRSPQNLLPSVRGVRGFTSSATGAVGDASNAVSNATTAEPKGSNALLQPDRTPYSDDQIKQMDRSQLAAIYESYYGKGSAKGKRATSLLPEVLKLGQETRSFVAKKTGVSVQAPLKPSGSPTVAVAESGEAASSVPSVSAPIVGTAEIAIAGKNAELMTGSLMNLVKTTLINLGVKVPPGFDRTTSHVNDLFQAIFSVDPGLETIITDPVARKEFCSKFPVVQKNPLYIQRFKDALRLTKESSEFDEFMGLRQTTAEYVVAYNKNIDMFVEIALAHMSNEKAEAILSFLEDKSLQRDFVQWIFDQFKQSPLEARRLLYDILINIVEDLEYHPTAISEIIAPSTVDPYKKINDIKDEIKKQKEVAEKRAEAKEERAKQRENWKQKAKAAAASAVGRYGVHALGLAGLICLCNFYNVASPFQLGHAIQRDLQEKGYLPKDDTAAREQLTGKPGAMQDAIATDTITGKVPKEVSKGLAKDLTKTTIDFLKKVVPVVGISYGVQIPSYFAQYAGAVIAATYQLNSDWTQYAAVLVVNGVLIFFGWRSLVASSAKKQLENTREEAIAQAERNVRAGANAVAKAFLQKKLDELVAADPAYSFFTMDGVDTHIQQCFPDESRMPQQLMLDTYGEGLQRHPYYSIDTSPNNNDCLIHSFLINLSPSFRSLPLQKKELYADWFRRRMMPALYSVQEKITDRFEYNLVEGFDFLSDAHAEKLARAFSINIITLEQIVANAAFRVQAARLCCAGNETQPSMVIYNPGDGHFRAILNTDRKTFLLSPEEAAAIMNTFAIV